MSPRRNPREERGVVLIITALLMTVTLLMAALVIDIGLARTRVQLAQTTVDLAATAGAAALGGGHYDRACENMIVSLATNIRELASISPSLFCTQSGNSVLATECSGGALVQARPRTIVAGYEVEVRFPVPDTQIVDEYINGARSNDGHPCERMHVSVRTSQQAFFGGISGLRSFTVSRSATVRAIREPGLRIPALWLLDPVGCVALNVGGGSQVTVGTPSNPGVIAVDSDASACQSNQVTVSASGTGTRLHAVPTTGSPRGRGQLRALPSGATACAPPACADSDVVGGRLAPLPTGSRDRSTRGPVDWRFNCKANYPTYYGIPITGCPENNPAYLDRLRIAAGSSGAPAGYQRWRAFHSCNPAGTIIAAGNWWVDCPGNFSIGNGTTVIFSGGNVIMDGDVRMTGGELRFNTANPTAALPDSCIPPNVTTPCMTSSSANAAFLFQRSGSWRVNGGILDVNRTAVILENGTLQVGGGAPPRWVAPTEGPFAALSFWSEAQSSSFSLAGGAGAQLTGVFFTPGASPFSLSGGGDWGQQQAQFISYRLAVSGGGILTMAPNPSYVAAPTYRSILIR